jgi:hypothetical protein
MPETDMADAIVIGAESGHIRTTKNWVLGRLLRDEDYRVDREMRREQAHQSPAEPGRDAASTVNGSAGPAWEALRVTVYCVNKSPPVPHGEPTLDLTWFLGVATIVFELVVAAIPWILYGQLMTFVVAFSGNLLAVISGSLPQWKVEKWSAPCKGGDTITLTQGNGSRHAVVILGCKGVGLDLEIMARGTRALVPSWRIKTINVILTLLWICLLITVAGMQDKTYCEQLHPPI